MAKAGRTSPKRTTTSKHPVLKPKQAPTKTVHQTAPAQTITASTEVASEDGGFPIVGIGASADMEEPNSHHKQVTIRTLCRGMNR